MKKLFLLFVVIFNYQTAANPIYENNVIGIFGDKFQGDIKLTKAQEKLLLNNSKNSTLKTGWTWDPFRWPTDSNGLVIVPYRINCSEGFLEREIEMIKKELTIIEHTTCIRFVPRTTEDDFIEFINGDGCWSWMGRVGGAQELSLSRLGCVERGIPLHEVMHALGYDHMHNHIDRDDYVAIHWENILPESFSNFDKVDPMWFSNFETPYDLLSVMHYPRWAFSYNGEDAIVPHDINYIDKIGLLYFSSGDALRLNRMYNCDKTYDDK